jgi:hypothetical protein
VSEQVDEHDEPSRASVRFALDGLGALRFEVALAEGDRGRAEPGAFFNLVLRVGAPGDSLARFARLIVPRRLARRMTLQRALVRLGLELDKHASRARSDMAQRLEAARHRFEISMAADMDRAAVSVAQAARRTAELRQGAEIETNRKLAGDELAPETIENVGQPLARRP